MEESRQGGLWQARLEATGLALGLERLLPRREAEDLELQDVSWGGQVLLFLPPGRHLQFAEWLIGTALAAGPPWGHHDWCAGEISL